MSSSSAPRFDRPPAIERAVQLDAVTGSWSCRPATTAGMPITFGPMVTAHANGVKYGRPRRNRM